MRDEVRIARLIREARRGNEESFGELLEEHRDSITSTLIACGIRTAETAGDLTQDTALRAWLRLDTLKSPSSFSPWIRQIAANAARDHLRRLMVRREESLESASQLVSTDDPSRDVERRAEIEEMKAALSTEDDANVALLKERANGVPVREIADRLGVSESALKMRIMRIRQRLRRRLERLRESD